MKAKKSKKGNLENKRGIFFQIGLILSLAFVLVAFEWKSEQFNKIDRYTLDRGDEIEEIIDITIHKKEMPVKPKPVVVPVFVEVIDETEIDEEFDFTSEVTDETENTLDNIFEEPDEEPDEPVIFKVVENPPSFPGGMEALYKFLAENLQYPRRAIEAGISGPVYVNFIVWNDGSIRATKIQRGIGGGCDEEALRVFDIMPNWEPGLQRTKAVNVQMSLPIRFTLTN